MFIKDFRSAFPEKTEQQAIAKFLDQKIARIDALIEKKKALIEKLNEQRMALITSVVTGKVKVEKATVTNGTPTYQLIPQRPPHGRLRHRLARKSAKTLGRNTN